MNDELLNGLALLILLGGGAWLLFKSSPTYRLGAIQSYSAAANNMPLAGLNGASLASYEPTQAYVPIATQPLVNFDVNQMAVPVGS